MTREDALFHSNAHHRAAKRLEAILDEAPERDPCNPAITAQITALAALALAYRELSAELPETIHLTVDSRR